MSDNRKLARGTDRTATVARKGVGLHHGGAVRVHATTAGDGTHNIVITQVRIGGGRADRTVTRLAFSAGEFAAFVEALGGDARRVA